MIYKEKLSFVANGEINTTKVGGVTDPGLLTPDLVYSGLVGKVLLGETVVVGDVLYAASATQDFKLCDASTGVALGPVSCMALEAGDVDEYVLALFDGYVRYDSWLTTEYLALKARGTFTMSDVTIDEETLTVGASIIGNDISDNGVAGCTDLVVPAGTSMAQFQTALSLAAFNAICLSSGVKVETDWAANALAIIAINAGIAGNLIATTETFTNSAFGGTTLSGGTDAGKVYMSETPGKITPTAPSDGGDLVQVVGISVSPTELLFKPEYQTTA